MDKVFKSLGSHGIEERETNDLYCTDPKAVELLLKEMSFSPNILEPCAGHGHISKVLENAGYKVTSQDLIDRGYGEGNKDFLAPDSINFFNGDIITNPPYKLAEAFLLKSLDIIPEGNKVVLFLRLLFLEGQKRGEIFKKYPPKYVYVSRSRLLCSKNGIFDKKEPSAMAYAWYVFQKGNTSEPIIRWFN